jgi:hypothetical protein
LLVTVWMLWAKVVHILALSPSLFFFQLAYCVLRAVSGRANRKNGCGWSWVLFSCYK